MKNYLRLFFLLIITSSCCFATDDNQVISPEERENTFIKEKVELSPKEQAIIEYNHATILLQNGTETEAITHLHNALKNYPRHKQARLLLIEHYRNSDTSWQVEELIKQGLTLDPTEPVYIKLMASLLNDKKEYGRALSLLLKMPNDKQNDTEYRTLLAFTYLHEGLFHLSQKNYKRLLMSEPRNTKLILGLAITQDAMGEYHEALENFDKANNYGGLDSDTVKFVQQKTEELKEKISSLHNKKRRS